MWQLRLLESLFLLHLPPTQNSKHPWSLTTGRGGKGAKCDCLERMQRGHLPSEAAPRKAAGNTDMTYTGLDGEVNQQGCGAASSGVEELSRACTGSTRGRVLYNRKPFSAPAPKRK